MLISQNYVMTELKIIICETCQCSSTSYHKNMKSNCIQLTKLILKMFGFPIFLIIYLNLKTPENDTVYNFFLTVNRFSTISIWSYIMQVFFFRKKKIQYFYMFFEYKENCSDKLYIKIVWALNKFHEIKLFF